jgi:hypothetical protein
MQRFKAAITCIFSIFALFAGATNKAIAAPKEIVVTQLDNTISLTDDAVRIKNKTGNFILVAKAPDWKITCFRTDRKVYWQTDLNRFTGLMLLNSCVPPHDPVEATFLGPKKYKGYDCLCYKSRKGMIVYGAKNIKVSSKVAELLCRYLFMPNIKEVPLFESSSKAETYQHKDWFDAHRYKDFMQRTPVTTISIATKTYDPKDFVVPAGLKKMSQPTDVSYSDANKSDLEGMIEGVGFMGKDK